MKDNEFYPLTHQQKSMWYLHKLYSNSITNIAGTIKINRDLNSDLMNEAINLLIKKHISLRIRIKEIDGVPYQYISKYKRIDIDYLNITYKDTNYLYNWDKKETIKPFRNLDEDLFYFALLKISDNEYRLYSKLHHLISDAWSIVKMANIIMNYYKEMEDNLLVDNKILFNYIDYIKLENEYINSKRFSIDELFWNEKIKDIPLATTLKKTNYEISFTESQRKTFIIPEDLTKNIRQFCKIYNVSIFSIFLSVLSIYLNRMTEQEDQVFGTPVLNRSSYKEKEILGMFASTVPIRIKVRENLDFLNYVKYITSEWYSILRHQKYPYSRIIENARKQNKKYTDNSNANIFEILLSYQNAKFDNNMTLLEGRWHFNGHQKDSLYIHINDRDDYGHLIIDYDYKIKIFTSKEIEYLNSHLNKLLVNALTNPNEYISRIDLLSNEERNRIILDFNNTNKKYSNSDVIHNVFDSCVIRIPDAQAVVFKNKTLTYKQLYNVSNIFSEYLRSINIGPNDVVGVLIERSPYIVIAILAILKAGGAFLPLDPEYPSERVNFMIENSKLKVLITQKKFENKFNILKISSNVIYIEDVSLLKKYNNDTNEIRNVNNGKDLAYIIYTSGSTGLPKGVMIRHESVVNFINAISDKIDFNNNGNILAVTTVSFDIFIFELFSSLLNGLRLIIADEEEQKIPEKLSELIINNKINKIMTTPSRMQLLIYGNSNLKCFTSLTEIILGGEPFPNNVLVKLKELTNAKIYNLYGPTEATVYCTLKDLTDTDEINIGRPLNNYKVYILDKYLNLVPIGIKGELFVGGTGVSTGYHNSEKLSKERFVNNPYLEGDIIYRTGDIARWYPRGEIQCYGRNDSQIKIRGFRVELKEIENVILSFNYIKDCVVVDIKNTFEDIIIAAYIVTEKEIDLKELKLFLNVKLPKYMVPSYIMEMKNLPVTLNGKIDKAKLPDVLVKNNINTIEYERPRNKTDELLINTFSKIIKTDKISINESFFDLGGDSLSVIRLQAEILKNGYNLSTQCFYDYKTIKELSEYLDSEYLMENKNKNNVKEQVIFSQNTEFSFTEDRFLDESHILLTGSTGYLGIHILEQLINNTNNDVYCIIRGKTVDYTYNKILHKMKYYFNNKYEDEIKRIKVIKGDISLENFGMEENEYFALYNKINVIIHTAAVVKYYGEKLIFDTINVNGTRNVIKFASSNKKLYHISTLGVSGDYLVKQNEGTTLFTENNLYIGQNYHENLYIKSKFESEEIIHQEFENGLNASILRIGNLTGRYYDGLFQENFYDNEFYNLLITIIKIKMIPEELLDFTMEFTPVDLCSRAIFSLLKVDDIKGRVFHLYNNNYITFRDFIKILSQFNLIVEIVDILIFKEKVEELFINNSNIAFIWSALNNISRSIQNKSKIVYNSENSLSILNKLNFSWPRIDKEYVERILNYMLKN